MRGHVVDAVSGEPLPGAAIVATVGGRPVATEISGEEGEYELVGLAAGRYDLTVYYVDAVVTRPQQPVRQGWVRVVDVRIDSWAAAVDTIEIAPGPAPAGTWTP